MLKVGILGHFGEGKNLLNGQTIKTKNITEELEKQLGSEQVLRIDTYGGWKTLLKAPFQVFYVLKKSKNVLMFPAHNGLRVYAPLLVALRFLFKKRKIHYVVIGGWLPQFLMEHKMLSKILKNFDGIYVETSTMKSSLNEQGFENVYVVPNCKKLTILSEKELVYPVGMPYRLCTFSRVMREKGIEDAVNAVIATNKALGFQAFSLDIYGQVEDAQTEWFHLLEEQFPLYIRYGGQISSDKSTELLKNYFALLFPTYYEGEGFAGTLIDAYSAGVPVIASDWKYNKEIVHENVGWIYPPGSLQAFVDILIMAAKNPFMLLSKKKACLIEAEKYRVDKNISILIGQMENH